MRDYASSHPKPADPQNQWFKIDHQDTRSDVRSDVTWLSGPSAAAVAVTYARAHLRRLTADRITIYVHTGHEERVFSAGFALEVLDEKQTVIRCLQKL